MENQTAQNTNPPTPPQSTTPPVSPVFPKKNNLVVILLSVLLLITFLIGGYLFLKVQDLTKQLAQIQVEVQATPIPSPTEASAQVGWFKVAIDTPISQEIKFNWWIIN